MSAGKRGRVLGGPKEQWRLCIISDSVSLGPRQKQDKVPPRKGYMHLNGAHMNSKELHPHYRKIRILFYLSEYLTRWLRIGTCVHHA